MVRSLGLVTRSMAIKFKGPESSPRETGVRARQMHVILDHFLFLLHPHFTYMQTRVMLQSSLGIRENSVGEA